VRLRDFAGAVIETIDEADPLEIAVVVLGPFKRPGDIGDRTLSHRHLFDQIDLVPNARVHTSRLSSVGSANYLARQPSRAPRHIAQSGQGSEKEDRRDASKPERRHFLLDFAVEQSVCVR
jgi:hypothetical protein